MSDVHFFIDPTGISSQSTAQQFGPVDANEYRVTSAFAIAGSPTAYAICRGRVLVQPQTGATGVVNLILKPMDQPIEGLNIKYFIYRGLSEADFFTTVGADKVVIPASGASELISKIRTEFTNFHNLDPDPEPTFLAKFIGYDPSVSSAQKIDNLFFKESDWSSTTAENHFELPMITMGKSLGRFTGSNCGIEVVINHGDYIPDDGELEFNFDLSYARAAYAKIIPTGTDPEKKTIREQVHQFLDIAAFYGYFQPSSGGVGYGPLANNTKKTGNSIYTDLLDKFATKNRFYLHIISDRGRSYNFYNNYLIEGSTTNSMKMGIAPGSTTALTATGYTTSNGWPIIIDNTTRTGSNPTNSIFVQFTTDTNDETTLYYQVYPVDKNIEGTVLKTGKLLGDDESFTKEIEFKTPAISAANISAFAFILYTGKKYQFKTGTTYDENNAATDQLQDSVNNDGLFDLITASDINPGLSFNLSTSLRQRIASLLAENNTTWSFAVSTSKVFDSIATNLTTITSAIDRVTYITTTRAISDTNILSSGKSIASEKINSFQTEAFNKDNTFSLPQPYFYDIKIFSDASTSVNGVRIKVEDNVVKSLFMIGLSKQEHDLLKTAADTSNLRNPRLYLLQTSQVPFFTTPDNQKVWKKELTVVGENANNKLEIARPSQAIVLYSLDNQVYHTAQYSKYMNEIVQNTLANKGIIL